MAKRKTTNKSTDGEVRINLSQAQSFFDLGFDFGGSRGRPNKPYHQVEWVWKCINILIDTCKSIQMMLTTGEDKIVESGPVYDFLFQNKSMPFSKFISETVGYYSLYRTVYWIFAAKDGIAPSKILVAGPKECQPVIESGVVVGYKLYTAGGEIIPLFLEDVWPITNFNPDYYQNYTGVGPTESGELSISANHQATQFNEAILRNGAKPGTLLIAAAGVKLDDAERRALKAEFDTQHGGARQAGKTFLATGGLDVKNFGQTMAELQMIDLRKYDAATICTLFGVPAEMVNLNSEAQFAHGPATQRFILYTMAPILSFIAENITLGILYGYRFKEHTAVDIKQSKIYCGQNILLRQKEFYRRIKLKAIQSGQSVYAFFDVESHPAMQEMQLAKAEKVLKYVQNGVPLNQIVDAYDLPFDTTKMPWGDEYLVSPALVPARWIIDAGPGALTEPPLPEGGTPADNAPAPKEFKEMDEAEEKDDETRKLRIWNNWKNSWAEIEKEYTVAMRQFFLRQKRELLDKLNSVMTPAKSQKAEPDKNEVIARVVLDLKKERNKIIAINKIFFDKASELGIRQIASEAGIAAGEVLTGLVETAKRDYAVRQALIIQSQKISDLTANEQRAISNSLQEGLDSGEGLNDLTDRLKNYFSGNLKKAQSVARTQVGSAVSAGRQAGMVHTGIELKIWLDSHDNNVRKSHRDAGKEYANGIPVKEYFLVKTPTGLKEAMMQPGDPHGSAANVINCRCVALSAKSGESKGACLARYEKVKFLSFEDMQIKAA